MFGSSWINNFARLFRIGKLRNDNIVFRLSTSLTSGIILGGLSILLTNKIWGDNITCMSSPFVKENFLGKISTFSAKIRKVKMFGLN